jgi:hypothetical protein
MEAEKHLNMYLIVQLRVFPTKVCPYNSNQKTKMALHFIAILGKKVLCAPTATLVPTTCEDVELCNAQSL